MTDETKPTPTQREGQAPVAWLVPSDETGFCRIWWRDKESADAWIAKHPHCTLVPLYATPTHGQPAAVAEVRSALDRCRNVLWNMALEYEGAIFRRWPINHEPLRNDARGLIPVIDSAFVALAALTRSVEATDATINNPLSDSRVGVEAGEPQSELEYLKILISNAVDEYPVASGLYVDTDGQAGYGSLKAMRLYLRKPPIPSAQGVGK